MLSCLSCTTQVCDAPASASAFRSDRLHRLDQEGRKHAILGGVRVFTRLQYVVTNACLPAGQESGTPEPEGPSTVGRSRYRTSPTLRALPSLQIALPEAVSPDASFSEGAVSPREQEAAQQMQALHQGVGAYTGFGREGALLGQPQGPSLLNPAYGVPIGFPQQELEAEREEYEDDGSEADDA